MRRALLIPAIVFATLLASTDLLHAWGGQGHRLVGLLAAERLTPVAKQNVAWLLEGQSLADVASWADSIRTEQAYTGLWHYVDLPVDATAYDRDRDCPRQTGVEAGTRSDRWRDCVVDRIGYWEERLANPKLDRADRATALKFIVHFIGDVHQPFHGIGPTGGNDIPVRVFGQADCGNDPARPSPCNLHSVWDGRMISRRNLDERQYVEALQKVITDKGFGSQPPGTPTQWAEQSFRLAKEALVKPDTNIDEAYYRRHIGVVEDRLALAGVRLAADLNRILSVAPPK